MSQDIIRLTPEAAESIAEIDGGYGHVFIQSGPMFVGADWSKDEILEAFKSAQSIQVGGVHCMNMGHGIVVFPDRGRPLKQSDLLFVAHNAERMAQFEAQFLAAKDKGAS